MNSRIKLSARAALNGSQLKILPYITAILLLFAVFSFCNAAMNRISLPWIFSVVLPVVFMLFSLATIAPLRLGLQIKHLLLARGIKPFHGYGIGFSGMLKACELSVCLFFIKLFWFAVFEAIPAVLSVIFIICNINRAISLRAAFIFFSGIFIISIVGLGFYLLYTQRYSKSMFYLACYKDFTVSEAIAESVKRTRDKCADILFFKIGFVPWFLLCVLIFPIFFVIPYYKQSVTCLFLSR